MINGTRYQLQREVNRQLRLANDIARGQAQVSAGGKRILAPSDDPIGAARLSEIRRTEESQKTWRANLDTAAAQASNAEGVLDTLTSSFDRVAELMLAVSNGTLSPENRDAAALEIESIAQEVAVLRNTRDSRGELLFPPAAAALRIPVGPDLEIAAVGTREAVFDTVNTPAGVSSLTAILDAAVIAVRNNDPAAIADALAATNAASDHVIAAHAEQGSRGARIETLINRAASFAVDLKIEASSIGDVSIPELVATLQAKQLSLEAAQATFARINRNTLFDLLT